MVLSLLVSGAAAWWRNITGILDVTAPPYSADNTGSVDVSAALQAAIDFARLNGDYRHLLIVNSTNLRIQMLDPEHGGLFAPAGNQTAMVELRNATNVTIYAVKFEAHSPGLWIHQRSEATVYGLGGMDSPNRDVPPARDEEPPNPPGGRRESTTHAEQP